MNNKIVYQGIELEKRMIEAFTKEGWECQSAEDYTKISNSYMFSPDIILTKNGHIYGFVECYFVKKGDKLSTKKQEQISYILESYKPEIFILTNGSSFEMYYDGKYAGNMTVPISYSGYLCMKRLSKYAELLLLKGKNAKDNK